MRYSKGELKGLILRGERSELLRALDKAFAHNAIDQSLIKELHEFAERFGRTRIANYLIAKNSEAPESPKDTPSSPTSEWTVVSPSEAASQKAVSTTISSGLMGYLGGAISAISGSFRIFG